MLPRFSYYLIIIWNDFNLKWIICTLEKSNLSSQTPKKTSLNVHILLDVTIVKLNIHSQRKARPTEMFGTSCFLATFGWSYYTCNWWLSASSMHSGFTLRGGKLINQFVYSRVFINRPSLRGLDLCEDHNFKELYRRSEEYFLLDLDLLLLFGNCGIFLELDYVAHTNRWELTMRT